MEETPEYRTATLSPTVECFVLEWGDIGSAWGVNRSIAQVHALLYALGRPMTADEISRLLNLARSNVSTSLKELQAWQLIAKVPVRGDRRDHFAAEADLWEMALRIADGRRAREIDPARRSLARCLEQAADDPHTPTETLQRLRDLEAFVSELSGWYDEVLTIPPAKLRRLIRMGRRIAKLVA